MAYNKNESSTMILNAYFFYLLSAFMNFYCHLVSMETNAFNLEINFLLYMGKKLF